MRTVIGLLILVVGSGPARGETPARPTFFAELGPVVGLPQSNIKGDAGASPGARVVGGVQVSRWVGIHLGYRRFWLDHDDPQSDVSIWTNEILLGARGELPITTRLRGLVDLDVTAAALRSRDSSGFPSSTWNHSGVGVAGRLGIDLELHRRWSVDVALGASYAETKYDDSMGVGWLSLDVAVVGRL